MRCSIIQAKPFLPTSRNTAPLLGKYRKKVGWLISRIWTMSSTRVFSKPRLRNSFTAVLIISWRSRAFLRSRRPGISRLAAFLTWAVCLRFVESWQLWTLRRGMAGESIRAILARAMIRYSPELITRRADARIAYCDGYSNMIVTNVKLQPSDATPRSELFRQSRTPFRLVERTKGRRQ